MHFSRLALLLAPLLAKGSSQHNEPDGTIDIGTATETHSDFSKFDLYFHDDDEAFSFNIHAFERPAEQSCGKSQLSLHEDALRRDWHQSSPWDRTGVSESSVVVESIRDGENHSLTVSVSSTCLSGHAPTDDNDDESLGDSVVELTTVVVTGIDGQPAKSPAGFNVYLDQQTGKILKVLTASAEDIKRVDKLRELLGSNTNDELARERKHLSYLESQLSQLSVAVDAQKSHLKLLDEQAHGKERCKSVRCAFCSFIKDLKGHLAIFVKNLPSFGVGSRPKCARGQKLLGSHCEPVVSESQATSASDPQVDAASSDGPSSNSTSPDLSTHTKEHVNRARDYVFLPLAVLGCVLCFTCVSFSVCRFCFSARAQADLRARCEEIRNRRQYRRLQRQYEWKQWWSRLLGKPAFPSPGDYEEKRSHILSQEHVLESVMQEELYRLRLEAGMSAEMARAEATGADGTAESLPPYATRMSDRPPSYRTNPSDSGSITRSRSDSGTGDVLSISEVTPDSSIAALSPRHSSETLRTDAGIV